MIVSNGVLGREVKVIPSIDHFNGMTGVVESVFGYDTVDNVPAVFIVRFAKEDSGYLHCQFFEKELIDVSGLYEGKGL